MKKFKEKGSSYLFVREISDSFRTFLLLIAQLLS
jgi:hypothetical protein